MNWRLIWTLIRRDLKVVLQSKAVLIPLIAVPVLLLVLMPGIGASLIANVDPESSQLVDVRDDLNVFYDNLPQSMSDKINALDTEPQRLIYVIFVYFFAPFFLIIPVMVANVIAADSFVGEKERKTLEALLYTPTTDRELYFAKLLSPWLAALAVTITGFVLYAVVVNVAAWPAMGQIFFPNLTWLLLVLWVAPAASGLGLGAMVLVSARTNTFQEATQLGGVIVLPVLLLVAGQLGGVLYFSPLVTVLLGAVIWAIVAGMVWYGSRTFNRGELLSRV